MSPFRFAAMGTDIEVWGAGDRGGQVIDWFDQVEAVASRFLPNSELSAINRQGAPGTITLSPILADLVDAADRARRISGGLVDVGVGRVVKAWGYDRTFVDISDLGESPEPIAAGDWEIEGRVLRRSRGTEIDLGGIAKGWTCDRAVETGLAAVVAAGGDIRSADPDTVASVTDANGEVVLKMHVGVGALATSSVGKRRWIVAGSEVSHIVDPRTMRPVQTPVVTATALASTAVDAETGAKAVLLLGEDGLAWASRQSWLAAAVVVWHDGSVYGTPGLEVAA
jgi:thiamine biosynthesis lipoprotein